jgi:hypothetical protein
VTVVVAAGEVVVAETGDDGASIDGRGCTTSLEKRIHLLVAVDSTLDSLQGGKVGPGYALRSKTLSSWLLERAVPFENSA